MIYKGTDARMTSSRLTSKLWKRNCKLVGPCGRHVGFWAEGKLKAEYPEKKSLGARKKTNKLSPHKTPDGRTESGPHWLEASTLTTTPSLLLFVPLFFLMAQSFETFEDI